MALASSASSYYLSNESQNLGNYAADAVRYESFNVGDQLTDTPTFSLTTFNSEKRLFTEFNVLPSSTHCRRYFFIGVSWYFYYLLLCDSAFSLKLFCSLFPTLWVITCVCVVIAVMTHVTTIPFII